MIPCRYCGGTPEVRHYRSTLSHYKAEIFTVTCRKCGARTPDRLDKDGAVFAWDREVVLRSEDGGKMTRYTEIDGRRYVIERCAQCPFLVVEYRRAKEPTCRYPNSEKFIDLREIDYRKEVHSGCPLRKVVG